MMATKGLLGYRSLLFHRACFIPSKTWVEQSSFMSDIKPFDKIPGPMRLPVLKSVWVLLPYIGDYNMKYLETSHLKFYKKYGPIVRFDTPNRGKGIFVFDPQDFRKVFAEEGFYPARPLLNNMVKYRKSKPELYPNLGLFFQDGYGWKQLRDIAQKPMLKMQTVRSYIPAMEAVSNDFMEKIRMVRNERMQVDDFIQLLYAWALESVGTFVLHRRLGCIDKTSFPDSEPQRLIKAVGDSFKNLYLLEFGDTKTMFFPNKAYAKLSKAQDCFAEVVRGYLHEATKNLKEKGARRDGEQVLLLDTLLMDSDMQVDLVYGIVMDFFFAGIDTTSSTAAFLLYWLGSHPEKQELLRKEILRALPDKNAPIDQNHVEAFRYLRACLKESLRLNPITIGTGRFLDHDIVLSNYNIPKNTLIAMIPNVASRLEKYYERAEEFIPERWLHGSQTANAARAAAGLVRPYSEHDGYASIPFGHGIRMCIGRRFAEQEVYLLLIRMMQNFRVEYNGSPIKLKQGVANAPDRPLNLVFREL